METGEIRCSHRRTTPNFRLRVLFTRPHRLSKGFGVDNTGSAVTTVGTVLRSFPCASTTETGEIRNVPIVERRRIFALRGFPIVYPSASAVQRVWCRQYWFGRDDCRHRFKEFPLRVDDGNGRNSMFPSSNDAEFSAAGFVYPSASAVQRVWCRQYWFGRDDCRHRRVRGFSGVAAAFRMSTFRHRCGCVGTSFGDPALRGRCRWLCEGLVTEIFVSTRKVLPIGSA